MKGQTNRYPIFQTRIIKNASRSKGRLPLVICIVVHTFYFNQWKQSFYVGKCDGQIDRVVTIGRDPYFLMAGALINYGYISV